VRGNMGRHYSEPVLEDLLSSLFWGNSKRPIDNSTTQASDCENIFF